MSVTYVQIQAESNLPDISNLAPFKTVVIIEEIVTQEWRAKASSWLVKSGCLYMNAWGEECGLWDTAVDLANLEIFDFEDIPEDGFVMTTWHDDETMGQVFWFAKNLAFHPTVKIQNTLLFHISAVSNEEVFLEKYNSV